MLAHPWVVAGTGRFDTDLMVAAGGAIVAKGGAEGVHASALPAAGVGLVLKVADGATRAVAPAALALLNRLGALDGAAVTRLAHHANAPVHNVAGRVVGAVRARADF
jgi:L-asparaginase II